MILQRTRAILKHQIKEKIYKLGHLQTMIEENENRQLETSMGFRGQWEEHRRFQIDLLQSQGLNADSTMLEFGCGPLTLGLPLISLLGSGQYTGVDIRNSVLDISWMQIGKHKLSEKNPRLICATDFGEQALSDARFNFVWSISVLFHLTDEVLEQCFRAAAKRLQPDGSFLANVMIDMDNSTWLEFPFIRRTIEDYLELASRCGLKGISLGTIQQLGFKLGGAEKTNPMLKFQLA
jgi:ubiquinone/menaquinone biosynthesis C-methylase UbiE